MTEAKVVNEIKHAAASAGGVRALAKAWGLSPSYVCDLLNGRRAPSEAVCANLGIRKTVVVTYTREPKGGA